MMPLPRSPRRCESTSDRTSGKWGSVTGSSGASLPRARSRQCRSLPVRHRLRGAGMSVAVAAPVHAPPNQARVNWPGLVPGGLRAQGAGRILGRALLQPGLKLKGATAMWAGRGSRRLNCKDQRGT